MNNEHDIMNDFLAAALEDQEAQFRQFTNRPDWFYREVPPIPDRLFPEFMEVIGQMNIQWIQKVQHQSGGTTITFGSAMFSPQAVANVELWMKENRPRQ